MEAGAHFIKKPTEALQIIVETLNDTNRPYPPDTQVHACAAVLKVVPVAEDAALFLLKRLIHTILNFHTMQGKNETMNKELKLHKDKLGTVQNTLKETLAQLGEKYTINYVSRPKITKFTFELLAFIKSFHNTNKSIASLPLATEILELLIKTMASDNRPIQNLFDFILETRYTEIINQALSDSNSLPKMIELASSDQKYDFILTSISKIYPIEVTDYLIETNIEMLIKLAKNNDEIARIIFSC